MSPDHDPSYKSGLIQAGLRSLGYTISVDNWWGPKSERVYQEFIASQTHGLSEGWHTVMASSFADPMDIAAFNLCKAQGHSDTYCFGYGDNGVGCWGDDMTVAIPYCALPPEDMMEQWGNIGAAKHKPVEIEAGSKTITATLGDRMPYRRNIHNGAGIDLNPESVRQLGLSIPVFVRAHWRWA